MSLPPEQRRRKRKHPGQKAKGAPAQMDHASSGKARKKARQGEQHVHRDRYAT